MSTTKSLTQSTILDNAFSRYSRTRCQAGGRIRREIQRQRNSLRDKRIRLLHHRGLTFTAIAREVGLHRTTVSRLLRGIIRTCLDAADTAANVIAYPLAGAVRKLTPTQVVRVSTETASPTPVRRKPRKAGKGKPWNFYKGAWAGYFRRKHGQPDPEPKPEPETWEERQYVAGVASGLGRCGCGLARHSIQVCPMCGWNGY